MTSSNHKVGMSKTITVDWRNPIRVDKEARRHTQLQQEALLLEGSQDVLSIWSQQAQAETRRCTQGK